FSVGVIVESGEQVSSTPPAVDSDIVIGDVGVDVDWNGFATGTATPAIRIWSAGFYLYDESLGETTVIAGGDLSLGSVDAPALASLSLHAGGSLTTAADSFSANRINIEAGLGDLAFQSLQATQSLVIGAQTGNITITQAL